MAIRIERSNTIYLKKEIKKGFAIFNRVYNYLTAIIITTVGRDLWFAKPNLKE